MIVKLPESNEFKANLHLRDGRSFLGCNVLPTDYAGPSVTAIAVWIEGSVAVFPLDLVKEFYLYIEAE